MRESLAAGEVAAGRGKLADVNFDRGVYALAWRAFRANYEAFAALALLIAFADPVLELAGVTGALPFARSIFIPILVNQVALWTLMHGGRPFAGTDLRQVRIVRFVLWSVLLQMPAAILAIAVLDPAGLTGALAAMVAGYILTLAACGSILPEIAAGGRGDTRAALRRGRRAFRPALRFLLRGPVALGVVVLLSGVLPQLAGIPAWVLNPDTGSVSWVGTLLVVAVDLASIFADVLLGAALCMAWHSGGGATA